MQEELSELSGQGVSHLYGHSGSIMGLSYSTDQALLFSSSTDGTVRLWSPDMKKGLAAYKSVSHTLTLLRLAAVCGLIASCLHCIV